MSYRSILLQVDAGGEADERIRLAMNLASTFDANIVGVGAEAFEMPVALEYAYLDAGLIQQIQGDIKGRLKSAEARFRERVANVQGGLLWFSEMDYPQRVMAVHARAADLVIVGRPVLDQPLALARPSDVIMEAGRPVLLAPTGRDELSTRNIVVAWKDTRESRRAVIDALPFLKRAKAVHIVGVAESSGSDSNAAALDEVASYLGRHDVYCETETVSAGKLSVAACLHDVAQRHGADLIVAGAYGHSRLREWAFGGVTSDLIDASPQFVLFSH